MRARPRRLLPALALVVLWVGGPLVGLIHAAHERHTYCAEHGAFEEQHGGADAAASSGIRLPIPRDAGDDHDACAFSPFARGPVVATSAPPPPAWQAPAPPPPATLSAQDPPPPLPVLAVAPKSSPPLAC